MTRPRTPVAPCGKRALARIISGGQTGVDRAALDVAMAAGLPCGGWLPRGRRAEDGPLPQHYPLREARTPIYAERTRLNVRDADATLILTRGAPTGGTALTVALAQRLGKPCLIVDLAADPAPDPAAARAWLDRYAIGVLNVAGPRQSTCRGIYEQAAAWLRALLDSA